jgi:hypothetical protein
MRDRETTRLMHSVAERIGQMHYGFIVYNSQGEVPHYMIDGQEIAPGLMTQMVADGLLVVNTSRTNDDGQMQVFTQA